jgi:predicted anti-sigma-YlaC factor YlaD
VKEQICQVVSKERLVAYADGDLLPGEAEKVAEHIATCPDCQAVAEALERSLQVTQAIWKTGQVLWPETCPFDRTRSNRWSARKAAAIAASVLLLAGVGLTWQLLTERGEPRRVIDEELTAAEIEIRASRAALAAQMLAVADLFASQPGGKEYAVKRYNYLIDSFPGREESAQARLRLKTLIERRIKQ